MTSGSTLLRQMLARVSRGFVIAFHDIPAASAENLIDGLRPIEPIPLSEMVARSKAGKRTAGLCAITVDDGERRTVAALAPLFQRRQWPATFYLPTNYIEYGEAMAFQWWRNVAERLPSGWLQLEYGALDLSRPGSAQLLSQTMERLWHSTRRDAYVPQTIELMEAVARQPGVTPESMQAPPPATWAMIRRFAEDDLISFESHGVSHTAMSALSERELIAEMEQSRALITERTGRPCRHLAYPFGSPISISDLAVRVARRFYDSAVTMSLGHVDACNPYLLPRLPLYPENSMLKARAKIFLKCAA